MLSVIVRLEENETSRTGFYLWHNKDAPQSYVGFFGHFYVLRFILV